MTAAAVGTNLFQALDVERNVAAEVTLGGVLVHLLTQLGQLLLRQVAGALGVLNALCRVELNRVSWAREKLTRHRASVLG